MVVDVLLPGGVEPAALGRLHESEPSRLELMETGCELSQLKEQRPKSLVVLVKAAQGGAGSFFEDGEVQRTDPPRQVHAEDPQRRQGQAAQGSTGPLIEEQGVV